MPHGRAVTTDKSLDTAKQFSGSETTAVGHSKSYASEKGAQWQKYRFSLRTFSNKVTNLPAHVNLRIKIEYIHVTFFNIEKCLNIDT